MNTVKTERYELMRDDVMITRMTATEHIHNQITTYWLKNNLNYITAKEKNTSLDRVACTLLVA